MNEEAKRQEIREMARDRSAALDRRRRAVKDQAKKLDRKPKPTVEQVLKSWCLVEASFVSRMMPSGLQMPPSRNTDEDVWNALIAEKVLSGRTRLRLMVFHVVDRGFSPESFRLYDEPTPPALPKEITECSLTHDGIKRACWRNLLRLIKAEIAKTPATFMVLPVGDDDKPLPEAVSQIDLNPAREA